jgi:serine/threonine-protein kinase
VLLLPRLSAAPGAAVTVLLLVLLVGAHFGLMIGQLMWLKLMLPATLLLAGHLLLTTKHVLLAGRGRERSATESARANHSMGAGKIAISEVLDGGDEPDYAETVILQRGEVAKPMLGRYEILKELGKGAMGVVYQGRDPQTHRSVAIKTMALAQEFDADELAEVKERFFCEAEIVGRLQHTNIVTVFEAGEERDLAYIAMELLQGKDLVSQTRPGNLLPLPKVIGIIARVADALEYAHASQVVHRDIKPANIMYEPESDQVKVADFGIARITDSSKTRTGMVLGTPSYMSPEQLAGKKIDGRSDLFSLGVTLYQLCSGQLPFVGESMAQLMFKIASAPHADIRSIVSGVPDCLAAVIDKTLVKNPDQRYQTGGALAHDLRACLSILEMGT